MALVSGTRIGPYLIESLLGVGGMGEVYRAQDTRLGRPVAVKILPPIFGADADRVRRFEQEARAAAALNHPNIVAVHDVGRHDGTLFLVAELLEGQTLRERLAGRPLPVQVAIGYIVQIAEGLAAAHDKGIVHRDLKPENLFVTRDDRVKILDFGLAKLQGPVVHPDGPTALVPESAGTGAGQVLGTAGYMAPEQVRGEPADHRADIFALGAILYEMLGGRRAFARDSAIETMAAVLNEDPPELSGLETSTALVLDRIVRRCLAKRPERRFESAGDLAFALQTLGSSGSLPGTPLTVRRTPAFARYAAAGAVLVAVAVGAWMLGRGTAAPAEESAMRRLAVVLPEHEWLGLAQVAPLADGRTSIAISPDGSTLVLVVERNGTSELVVRALNRFETRRLPGTEGAYGPFFSPDGSSVGFFSGTVLRRVSLSGGDPATVCEARNAFGGIWMPDDTVIFWDQEGGRVVRVPATGGTPRAIVSAPRPTFITYSALPGGHSVLMGEWTSGSNDQAPIQVLSIETGEQNTIIQGGTHALYAATGHILFLRGASLFAVPFDVTRLVTTGSPVPVLDGIRSEQSGPGQVALASDGTLAYVEGGPAWIGRPVWVTRDGAATPVGMPTGSYAQLRLSPDGSRIAIEVRGAGSDIWVYETVRGTFSRLTQDGRSHLPAWTPDGRQVTYLSLRDDGVAIVTRPADGSGAEEVVWSGQSEAPWSWSPDGSMLAIQCGDTGNDICVLAMEGERRPRPIATTPSTEWGAAFSPTGRWIAYTSDASGRYEVYVRLASGEGGQWQISSGGGEEPVWSRDGRELFYRIGYKWMAVEVGSGPDFTAGSPRLLFEAPYQNLSGFSYDVTPDGERFLMVQLPDTGPQRRVNVILNWFAELRRVGQPRP
ncbi:MAG: protein kinase [Acidobacteria bacterium]|nr:protein kinase [Acidobacteriota bacterium]